MANASLGWPHASLRHEWLLAEVERVQLPSPQKRALARDFGSRALVPQYESSWDPGSVSSQHPRAVVHVRTLRTDRMAKKDKSTAKLSYSAQTGIAAVAVRRVDSAVLATGSSIEVRALCAAVAGGCWEKLADPLQAGLYRHSYEALWVPAAITSIDTYDNRTKVTAHVQGVGSGAASRQGANPLEVLALPLDGLS